MPDYGVNGGNQGHSGWRRHFEWSSSSADSGFELNGDVYLDVVVSAKGATIEGNVVDTKGQPVPHVTVAVVPDLEHRARPDSYEQERTDEHGHFIARGLNPGSYAVLAFEELQEDVRQPEFLKTYAGKDEKSKWRKALERM